MRRKKSLTTVNKKDSKVTLVPKAKKISVTESETVVNFMGGEDVITIGSNNQTLLKKLFAIKAPDSTIDEGRYATFTFNLTEYNFNFIPKKKRKGRKPSQEQVQKMLSAKVK